MSRSREKLTRSRRPQKPVKSSPGRLRILFVGVFLLCLVHLGGMNRTLVLARRVETLQNSCEELQRKVDRLVLEIAEENSNGRIVELARRRLGMVFPDEPTEVLAVLPAATRRGGSPWTYIENALVISVERIQSKLDSPVMALESASVDSSGGP